MNIKCLTYFEKLGLIVVMLFGIVFTGSIFASTTINRDYLLLMCPTGHDNSAQVGGELFKFEGQTPDGKKLKYPGFYKLCTDDSGNCKKPQIVDNKLYCYYTYNNFPARDVFYTQQTFQPKTQQEKAIDDGALFLPLK